MALKENALITLAVALDELGLTSDGGTVDARVTRYINAASEAISAYCRRPFEKATVTDEKHPTDGSLRIVVKRTPIISVTSIVVDDDTIDSDNFVVEDADAGLIYSYVQFPLQGFRRSGIAQHHAPGSSPPDTAVTYVGGFITEPQTADGGTYDGETPNLPADLEQACVELVTWYFRRKGTPGLVVEERIGDATLKYLHENLFVGENPAEVGIPLIIRGKLNRYRRAVIL